MTRILLGLQRVQSVLARLPTYTRPTLHIAGTNGKGSVSALLSSILLNANPPLRIGRFSTPHLVSVLDSITINNLPVSSTLYESVRTQVVSSDREHRTGLTSFEILTLVALQIFEKSLMDIVLLEVGMGGRLDATNVISDESVAVSALTAVDLDHQAFLGNTVKKIAEEKAGIGRPSRPFVLGKQKHAVVTEVVKEVLGRLKSSTLVDALQVRKRKWDEKVDGPHPPPFSLANPFQQPAAQPISAYLPCLSKTVKSLLPLHGNHQLDNLGTTLAIVDTLLRSPDLQKLSNSLNLKERINTTAIVQGIQNVQWPGRLTFHTLHFPGPSRRKDPLIVLVDGAHNSASAKSLAEFVTRILTLAAEPRAMVQGSECPPKPTSIELTNVISLSHSPPKTPLDTLSSILPLKLPSRLVEKCKIKTRVILLPFTQPDGMPWVKPIPLNDVGSVVKSLLPDTELVLESDIVLPPVPPTPTPRKGEGIKSPLEKVLNWLYRQRVKTPGAQKIVLLTGSLYLVSDFYRILQKNPRTKIL